MRRPATALVLVVALAVTAPAAGAAGVCPSGGPATTSGPPAAFSLRRSAANAFTPYFAEANGDGRTLRLRFSRGRRDVLVVRHPSPAGWRAFRTALEHAGLERLRRHYAGCPAPTDATSWSLALTLPDGRRVRSDGYYVQPAPLLRVSRALARLADTGPAGRELDVPG